MMAGLVPAIIGFERLHAENEDGRRRWKWR